MMKKDSIIREKSVEFAIRIINLYKDLCNTQKEFVMSKQILRSGTSIGANIAESVFAASDADFINKNSIARKESEETLFWIELLFKSNYIDEKEYKSLQKDCPELQKILTAIILSMKNKQHHNS